MKRFVAASAVSMMIISPAFAGDMDALRGMGATAALAEMCSGSSAIINFLEATGRKKLGDKSAFYAADNIEIRDAKDKLEKNNLLWDEKSQKYIQVAPINCSKVPVDGIKSEENAAIQQLMRVLSVSP